MVAFRPLGITNWIQTVVTSPDTPRYVFRNESILPFSPYEVKVGVYNNRGEGPFSPVATVFSAEEGGLLHVATFIYHPSSKELKSMVLPPLSNVALSTTLCDRLGWDWPQVPKWAFMAEGRLEARLITALCWLWIISCSFHYLPWKWAIWLSNISKAVIMR